MNTIHRRNARAAGLLLCALFISAFSAPAAAQWVEGGNPVVLGLTLELTAAPDGAGGAFVVWRGLNGASWDIYAQHIDAAGNPVWTPEGVNASAIPTTFEVNPDFVADDSGGIFVVWSDNRDGNQDVYVQHIDAAGTPAWSGGIGVVIWPDDQTGPTIASDGSGGSIVTWTDERHAINQDIRAQKLNSSGVHQWASGGVLVCTDTTDQWNNVVLADGAGGVFCAWKDGRYDLDGDIYAGRLDSDGNRLWSDAGIEVCGATDNQSHRSIVSDDSGGFIIAWTDYRSTTDYDIYAQRISGTGTPLWLSDGEPVCTANLDQINLDFVPDGHGGAVMVWEDERDLADTDLYAQRIDENGFTRWTYEGAGVATLPGDQLQPAVAMIAPDVFLFTWREPGQVYGDIHATALSIGGAPAWGLYAVVSDAPGDQSDPTLAMAGDGAGIVAFEDGRSGRTDIFCQRIEWRYGEWGNPECELMSVEDVPADEGGYVAVKWNASGRDRLEDDLLTAYQVWRSMEPPVVAAALAPGEQALRLVTHPTDVPDGPAGRVVWREGPRYAPQYWELVSTVTPAYQAGYLSTVSTPQDSVSTHPGVYWYKVLSVSYDEYWESDQIPGYSVDNLAPSAPLMLTAQRVGSDVALEWHPSGENEADFRDYVVYRGTTSGVTPEPVFYLSETPDSLLTDTGAPTGALYYIVTSRDIHENESEPSNEASVSHVTGIGTPAPALTSLQVRANVPNPFSGSTELRIGLPVPATVTVEVFDVAGRRVATREGVFGAGWQRLRFDGRDPSGKLLPSGVYFYRVGAAGETLTRKLVIHR